MKQISSAYRKVCLLTSILSQCFIVGFSQCIFTATITPNNPILCPNDTAYLSTEMYDSYQWYKDGTLLVGETNQTLMVTAANDGGSQFHVAATLASCTENSDTVLVDGWVFLLPYVITHTTPQQIGGSGEAYYCDGTVVELEMGMPYSENITWYENGNPIPGEDSTTIFITQSGNYTVSGAPAVCPDYLQYLGVTVPIIINPTYEPDWSDFYGGNWMFWYWNCNNCSECTFYYIDTATYGPLPVDTGVTFDPWTIGSLDNLNFQILYRAECYDSLGCLGIDTVMFDIESIEQHPFLQLQLYPNPATDIIQLYLQDDIENYQVRFIDMYGRIMKQQQFNSNIDLSSLSSGIYTIEVFSKKYYLRQRIIKQ